MHDELFDGPSAAAGGNGPADRRTFLIEVVALAAGFVASDTLAADAMPATPAITDPGMARLATFLTGKTGLPTDMVARAQRALIAEQPAFAQRMAVLLQRIDAAKIPDVEAFRKSTLAKDAELMATAVAVVHAFYVGRVGNGYRGHLVSYEQALMYRPTADVLYVPTFSRGGPGYWAEAPRP